MGVAGRRAGLRAGAGSGVSVCSVGCCAVAMVLGSGRERGLSQLLERSGQGECPGRTPEDQRHMTVLLTAFVLDEVVGVQNGEFL